MKSATGASLFTILIILLIVLVPLFFFGQILYSEINNILNQIKDGHLVINKDQITQSIPASLQNVIERFSQDISNFFKGLTRDALSSVSSLASNVFSFFLGLFVLFLSVFYLLRDGAKMKEVFASISPIASSQEEILVERITSAVNGVVKGQFLVALCQGVVATIGFFIFGMPAALLWGVVTVVAALVPNFGTSLVMIPAVAFLLVTGHTPQAIGLLIWAAIAVGMIDNVVGPKLVGSQLKLHPLLVLLAVIGGLQFFGFLGFLIGPILMAIFVQMVDMYRTDFQKYIRS